jgi:hypothetical protein
MKMSECQFDVLVTVMFEGFYSGIIARGSMK